MNGLRSALRKGLADWLVRADLDVVCLQEVRALPETDFDPATFAALGYDAYWFPAEKRGYSGVGILTRRAPTRVVYGCDQPIYDREGRVLRLDFADFSVMSVYMPSGSSGRQPFKFAWLDDFAAYLQSLRAACPPLIVSGDFNICHQPIDIHNPKANARSSGFLPEERAWFSDLLDSGYVDSFRRFHAEPHRYSWWSNRPPCRARNLGWRIDYHLVSTALMPRLVDADIHADVLLSDHCPVSVALRA